MLKLGLALGSGGARGLAHAGVLAVLEAEGLRPYCIAGTSMGSIVGALYAEDLDAALMARRLRAYTDNPEFRACWEPFIENDEHLSDRSFFSELRRAIQKKILTFKTFSTPSQRSTEDLLEPLRKLFRCENIEDLRMPFACVAVDLISGEPRVFRQGYLVTAIYASSAIPGVFPPLPFGGELLVDGGGPFRVPVPICRDQGADFVLAIDIPSFAPATNEFKTGLDVLMRSDAIARNRLNARILREADFVIRPDVSDFHWAHFAAADRIRQAGEKAARQALPALRQALQARESRVFRFKRSLRRLFARSA